MNNLDYLHQLLKGYEGRQVNMTIAPNDAMKNEWYFQVGRSAVEVVLAALGLTRVRRIGKVLDLPCGHGRVLWHLISLFPDAQFQACDLDKDGVDFCAGTFGAKPVYSREELSEVDFDEQFDLIWVGSLFTHTPLEKTRRWTAHLAKFLSPQGIVIATVHGRWCLHVHKVAPYIIEDRWKEIVEDFAVQGYGYRDYPQSESHQFVGSSFGVSVARSHVIIKALEEIPGVRLYSYLERGWADHQDVVVYGRPAHDLLWKQMAQVNQANSS